MSIVFDMSLNAAVMFLDPNLMIWVVVLMTCNAGFVAESHAEERREVGFGCTTVRESDHCGNYERFGGRA